MAKKKPAKESGNIINTVFTVLFWAGIVILAYLVFTYFSALPIFSGTESNVYTTPDGQTILKTNLGNLFTPYLVVSDVEEACFMADGDYFKTPDKVGCFNAKLNLDATTCVNTVVLSGKTQCEATQATWVCNTKNIGCYYG